MKTPRPLQRLLSILFTAMLLSGLTLHAAPVQYARAAGSSLFQPPVFYSAGSAASDIALGDINLDGSPDIVTTDHLAKRLGILINQGDGTFTSSFVDGLGEWVIGIQLHDMDGDGDLDAVVVDAGSDAVVILSNDGSGTFPMPSPNPLHVGDFPKDIVVADFNRDGKPDIAAANLHGETVSILLNAGNGNFLPQAEYLTGQGPAFLAVEDFNLDGNLDLAATNAGSTTVSVLLGKGDGTFQTKTDYGVGLAPAVVIAEDFNNDGRTDLAVANSQSDTVSIMLGIGNGTFEPKVDFAVGDQPYGMTAGDFNLDGKIDLVTANFYSGDLSLLLNQGGSVFAPAVGFPIGEYQSTVRSGDLDNDGKLDLVTENGNDSIAVLINASPYCGQGGSVCYVTPTGTGNCSSWVNACGLQTALAAAQPGSEIWVAEGTYKPTDGTDRTASFHLKDGVAIYGGFAGTEADRSLRNLTADVTILSGEIGVLNNPSDNSLHVVKGSGDSNTAVLDGFTITGGNANLTGVDATGGGMYLLNSSPVLVNLTFTANHASSNGGAVYVEKGLPSFTDSSFLNNSSNSNGGAIYSYLGALKITGGSAKDNEAGSGGAIYLSNTGPTVTEISNFLFEGNHAGFGGAFYPYYSPSTLTNVQFLANTATYQGGAINSYAQNPKITGALFKSNHANGRGGAMYDFGSGSVITNAVFYDNSSGEDGGGIYSQQTSTRITNSTFYRNSAANWGGGIAMVAAADYIRNTIVWGNTAPTAPQVQTYSTKGNMANCIIQGWSEDTLNKIYGSLNPMFVSTQAATLDLRLLRVSPAINLGDSSQLPANTLTDLDGNPRIEGASVDLGAYEQQHPNTPPVLQQTSFQLPEIDEDPYPNQGVLVRDLFQGAGLDADGDDLGIVTISADDSNGRWSYLNEADGGWYYLKPEPYSCCGYYLSPNARIRFSPSQHWNGTVSGGVVFRLWDQANAAKTGTLVNASVVSGWTSPFSTETGNISITVRPVNDPPYSSQAPTITGAPVPGQVLTANPGTWDDRYDSPTSIITFTYQWQLRDTSTGARVNIPGAVDSTYKVSQEDLGKYISFVVTATDNGVGTPPTASSFNGSAGLKIVSSIDIIAEGDSKAVLMDEDGSPTQFSLKLNPLGGLSPTWGVSIPPAHGTASVNSTGQVTYTPTANYHGTDQFTVSAQAGAYTDSISIRVTLNPRNDAPVYSQPPAVLDSPKYGFTVNAFPGVWNDNLDLNPGSLTYAYQWQRSPKTGGAYTDIPGATTLAYTPQAIDTGNYLRFSVKVTDNGEGTPESMVTLVSTAPALVANTAPVITEGSLLVVNASPLQLHATDADGNPLTWLISTQPLRGEASVNSSGLVTYRLYPNCQGMDEFTVQVTDGAASDYITIRPPAGACRFYVDTRAQYGEHNGSTWTDAFADLQTGLRAAQAGDEIWVAVGSYQPTNGTDRTASYHLKQGVAIYGSFRGDETNLSQRDWKDSPSILTCEIGLQWNNADNCYHVITSSDVTPSTILDGFIIARGNANGADIPAFWGGGMLNYSKSSPTLRNLIFQDNNAWWGGAMMNNDGSSPTISQVEFTNNQAYGGGAMGNARNSSPIITDALFSGNRGTRGGAMMNTEASNPRLTRVTFESNSTGDTGSGGGMNNENSSPILTDVMFLGNSADHGGGMYNDNSLAVVVNVKFFGNSAMGSGGGMVNRSNSHITMANVVFYGNGSQYGGAIANASSTPLMVNGTIYLNEAMVGGAIYSSSSSMMQVRNSILWDNQATTDPETKFALFDHSIVKGISNNPETGVYGDEAHNPRFAMPGSGDFRLLSGSPAINAGLSAWLPADTYDLDKDGNVAEPLPVDMDMAARINGTAVDLGAYEFVFTTITMAVDDIVPEFAEDTTQTIDVLANDSDPDGGSLTITSVTQGNLGGVYIVDNKVKYDPHSDVNGTDNFTYTVSNGAGLTDTATVYVTITPVNDDPYLDTFADTGVYAGSSYQAVFTINDVETGADALQVSVQSFNKTLVPEANISVTGSGSARTLTITPASGKTGATTITITVTDGNGGTTSASFTLTVKARKLFLPLVTE